MEKQQNKTFACPMHCEGDKTYNEPGYCPVCGMHLVAEKGAAESEEEKADH